MLTLLPLIAVVAHAQDSIDALEVDFAEDVVEHRRSMRRMKELEVLAAEAPAPARADLWVEIAQTAREVYATSLRLQATAEALVVAVADLPVPRRDLQARAESLRARAGAMVSDGAVLVLLQDVRAVRVLAEAGETWRSDERVAVALAFARSDGWRITDEAELLRAGRLAHMGEQHELVRVLAALPAGGELTRAMAGLEASRRARLQGLVGELRTGSADEAWRAWELLRHQLKATPISPAAARLDVARAQGVPGTLAQRERGLAVLGEVERRPRGLEREVDRVARRLRTGFVRAEARGGLGRGMPAAGLGADLSVDRAFVGGLALHDLGGSGWTARLVGGWDQPLGGRVLPPTLRLGACGGLDATGPVLALGGQLRVHLPTRGRRALFVGAGADLEVGWDDGNRWTAVPITTSLGLAWARPRPRR